MRDAPGPPVYKDSLLEAYAVPQTIAHQPFIELGDHWYNPEASDMETVNFHRWSYGQATLNLTWEGPDWTSGNFNIELGLLEGEKPGRILYEGHVIWSGNLSTRPQTISVPVDVSPGRHQLQIEVDGKAKRPTTLGLGNDLRTLLFYASDISFR